MNKNTALALAIAGIIAAPAASADVYVSARIGIDLKQSDNDDAEELEFGNLSSRLGWKGENDLGNGMTSFGKLEVGNLDNDATNGFNLRDLHVGLKGDFGKIIVGERVYTAFYNHVVGPVDQPYFATSIGLGKGGRTDRAITYQGGSDMFSFEVTAMADGTDSTEIPGGNSSSVTGFEAALSIGLGDNWTIAAGMSDAEDSTVSNNQTAGGLSGATVHGNIGDIGLAASFQTDDDADGITLRAAFGNYWAEYSQVDVDATDLTPTQIAVGAEWSLGENTSIWAEASTLDSDGGVDSSRITTALKVGF